MIKCKDNICYFQMLMCSYRVRYNHFLWKLNKKNIAKLNNPSVQIAMFSLKSDGQYIFNYTNDIPMVTNTTGFVRRVRISGIISGLSGNFYRFLFPRVRKKFFHRLYICIIKKIESSWNMSFDRQTFMLSNQIQFIWANYSRLYCE